jgi:hypothetical protein
VRYWSKRATLEREPYLMIAFPYLQAPGLPCPPSYTPKLLVIFTTVTEVSPSRFVVCRRSGDRIAAMFKCQFNCGK